jgi:hypothetical protein
MWARPSFAVASATWLGSFAIEGARQAGLHIAESAGTGAGVTHDHESCVLLLPALADIRATGLLAHRMQAVVTHDLLGGEITAETGAFTRIQSGFFWTGESGLCAFSG